LYYDRIGLLRPSHRTTAGYRRYGPREEKRMRRICELREAGLEIRDIHLMLGRASAARANVVARRLGEVAGQIVSLRQQQRLLVSLHQGMSRHPLPPLLDKTAWIEMLRQSGMDDLAMARWHAEFERRAPEEHGQFLASLGIPSEEIKRIRARHSHR
jgi:DNA-binding transcriptional MerR regulator